MMIKKKIKIEIIIIIKEEVGQRKLIYAIIVEKKGIGQMNVLKSVEEKGKLYINL